MALPLEQLALAGANVSVEAVDLATGNQLFSFNSHRTLPIASLGKVLLLLEVAAQLEEGGLVEGELLEICPEDRVGGTGLWQHLSLPALSVGDAAVLVAAESDNVATNALLRRVGLEAVRQRSASLGLRQTLLLDQIRDERGPEHPKYFSVGTTAELGSLMAQLAQGGAVSHPVSNRVEGWLRLNADLSLVASAFGLNPLAHASGLDHGLRLFNKTGSDAGLLSEAGALRSADRGVAYAAIIRFKDASLTKRKAVLHALHATGREILKHLYA